MDDTLFYDEYKKFKLKNYKFQKKDLRKNEDISDFILVINNNGELKEISCHKTMFYLNSGFFRTLFKQKDFVENKENKLEMKDINYDVLDSILHFIYKQEISDYIIKQEDPGILDRLYQLCDLWDIPELLGYLKIKKNSY